ncbi:MAG: histidine phosphatase family protein [Blautia sp.]|nr:histidine phosphatase family protein [Blautia sp.]
MKIWLTRHGQTRLNKMRLMQGLTDEPLNETGISQAKAMRRQLLTVHPDISFDAVYASPLNRAVITGAIIGGVSPREVIRDRRIIEADFGKYEQKKYYLLGPSMSLYWALPEVFPAPKSVESIQSMVSRSRAFLEELEKKDYENVLVACHGGILRALYGCLEDRPSGIRWRPKPHNCCMRIYESDKGIHRFIEELKI